MGAPIHLVAANAGPAQALSPSGSVQLAFDRLLLPFSITRQSFPMRDLAGNYLVPNVAYDPVARVVTISSPGTLDGGAWLQDGQTYRVDILRPQNANDPNGIRAIDGATLDPSSQSTVEFPVRATVPAPPPLPTVEFCRDVSPLLTSKCISAACHGSATPPAAGLRLDSPSNIAATAIGRVAQGANTGPRAAAQPPGVLFGEDMPTIDPGSGGAGSPGDSWMMYKLLLAVPCASADASECNAGAAMPPTNTHQVPWLPLSDSERATLSNFILGREMPYPADPGAPLGTDPSALTLTDLETVSSWIAQGAPLPANCP